MAENTDKTRMFIYFKVFNVEVKYNSYCKAVQRLSFLKGHPHGLSTSGEKNLAGLSGFAIYIYSQECTKEGICNISASPV